MVNLVYDSMNFERSVIAANKFCFMVLFLQVGAPPDKGNPDGVLFDLGDGSCLRPFP